MLPFSFFLANTGLHPFCYLCCSQTSFSWALLEDLVPFPGKRQRIFRETQAVGARGPFPVALQRGKTCTDSKKSGTLHPQRNGLHCYMVLHAVSWAGPSSLLLGTSDVLVGAEHGLHPLFCSLCLCLAPCRVPWSYGGTYTKGGQGEALVLPASVSACQVELMLPCCSQSKLVPGKSMHGTPGMWRHSLGPLLKSVWDKPITVSFGKQTNTLWQIKYWYPDSLMQNQEEF